MYNIDQTSITVSGFSAGGFMAAQLGIAYSSIFSGFGVFAGGPYDCARDQDFFDSCMGNHTPAIMSPSANIRLWSSEQRIDSIENLKKSKVYLQAGVLDEVVGLAVTRQLEKQLQMFVPNEQMTFVELEHAAHVFPVDFDDPDLPENICAKSVTPYIANCGNDGTGEMLKWLYNNKLHLRSGRRPAGTLHEYAQTESLGAIGLADHAYYYVPSTCHGTTLCRVHVALHGCTMSFTQIGHAFIKSTGYLQYADANDMIILFPQAAQDNTSRPIWHNGTNDYPGAGLACFDWVGWSGVDANWRGGAQMQAVVNMLEVLVGKECPSDPVTGFA